MEDRIGQQLGNYKLLRLLGQGGFADVYLGEHIHLRTQAAIKILQVRLGESSIQNFLNEARTIAHLVHPSIIRVLDFGVQDNTPFLVMDYAPRGTFRQRFLQGSPLPAAMLVPYIKQTAAALQYGHDKKLVHRDVKPENMLLSTNDEILLADFGLALIAYNTISRSPTETAGTAAYMAPEQLQGKPRPASDQYALGVIAYEWLTGTCPFEGSFFEVASQQVLAPPPSIFEKAPQTSKQVAAVVMQALDKDPQKRFLHVRDFAQALEEASMSNQHYPSRATASHKGSSTSMDARLLADRRSNAFPRPAQPNKTPMQSNSLTNLPTFPASNPNVSSTTHQSLSGVRIIPPGANSQPSMSGYPVSAQPPAPSANPNTTRQFSPSQSARQFSPSQAARQFSPSQVSQTNMPIFPAGTGSQANMPTPSSSQPLSGGSRPLPQGSHMTLAGIHPTPAKPIHSTEATRKVMASNQTSFTGVPFQANRTETGFQSKPLTGSGQLPGAINSGDKQPAANSSKNTFRSLAQTKAKFNLSTRNIIIVAFVILLIIGSIFAISMFNGSHETALERQNARATRIASHALATAQAKQSIQATQTAQAKIDMTNTYLPNGTSKLVLDDPLTNNRNNWQEGVDPTGVTGGKCTITDKGYQVDGSNLAPTPCFLPQHPHSNFTYQVNMNITNIGQRFSGAGIIFRANSDTKQYYFFEIFGSGNYSLQKCYTIGCINYIDGYKNGKQALTTFKQGNNVTNVLAVVAQGTSISLYLNKQKVSTVTDPFGAPFDTGDIGVMATGGNDTGVDTADNTITTAVFSHAKIWDIQG
ncbi:hypothetical protein KDW_20570 [Dictyobacter vulcani]|uniref:non-specific serine/threonine protein kinase n=1 Tax=Dictyobacter vulcani TaxID=2607529 RepID=A0A5J4KJB0_9CHLR|nr:serine/threonine-protein kinase [Dictyobacter vulcani]GER87895.1 hypothetical protein KDW_20570 [Dictyobacter vulcani]